jgi:hypothetical protein
MPKLYKPMRVGPRVAARILGTDAEYKRIEARKYDPATGTVAERGTCILNLRGLYEENAGQSKHPAEGSDYLHSEANRITRQFVVSADQFKMNGKEFLPHAGDFLTVPAPRTQFQEDYPSRRFNVVDVRASLVNERAVEFSLLLEDA